MAVEFHREIPDIIGRQVVPDIVVGIAVVQPRSNRSVQAAERIAAVDKRSAAVGYVVERVAPGVADFTLEAVGEGAPQLDRKAIVVGRSLVVHFGDNTEPWIGRRQRQAAKSARGAGVRLEISQ